MFPVRVGLASRTAGVTFADLSRVAAAINVQVSRDFGPIWNVAAAVMALEDPDQVPVGVWPIYIADQVDGDYAGVHLDDHNQPFAKVVLGPTWSLTASHECLEMLADPSANRLVSSAAVDVVDNQVRDTDAKYEYLVEVCDPCEDETCAYLIDDVLVSDFYTPRYFDPVAASGVRYSFSGKITAPRQILPNGYLSWVNPLTRTLQQAKAFGAPEIVDLGPVTLGPAAQALRAFVDRRTLAPVRLSNLPRGSAIVARSDQRKAFLAAAADQRGQAYAEAAGATLAARPAQAPAGPAPQPEPEAVLANGGERPFARPGVLSVRPGWLLKGGWISDTRAIVVTAKPDQVDALKAALPQQVQGVPVDIRPANALDLQRADDAARYAVMAEARHELRQPEFPDQTRFDGAGEVERQAPLALLQAARPQKPELPYTHPAKPLDPVTGPFSLVLHASPDAGWDQLSTFLGGVRQRLVVGMYDFTSAHVLDSVKATMNQAGVTLTLTLDHPAKNPTADQTDDDTQTELRQAMGARFAGAWALTRGDPKATKWIFPTAYHIKVAVRDDDTTWLSSGNWNNSNQPVIDLTDVQGAQRIAAKSDRDWHVIVTNAELADTFRAYLENDFKVAEDNNVSLVESAFSAASGAAPLDVTDVEVPADAFAAGRTARKFFAPTTVTGTFTIQPLLSPDNYQPQILALIRSATSKFYMQTQYIHTAAGPNDQGHAALIEAVQTLIDNGVDVRLITSEFETADWLEKLKDGGFDISRIRVQPKVHNKGIVVDGRKVVVSSQNWSADGTLRNRDAGLIIDSADAAAYFEQIFLYDWNTLSAQQTLR